MFHLRSGLRSGWTDEPGNRVGGRVQRVVPPAEVIRRRCVRHGVDDRADEGSYHLTPNTPEPAPEALLRLAPGARAGSAASTRGTECSPERTTGGRMVVVFDGVGGQGRGPDRAGIYVPSPVGRRILCGAFPAPARWEHRVASTIAPVGAVMRRHRWLKIFRAWKVLGWKTPAQVFQERLQLLNQTGVAMPDRFRPTFVAHSGRAPTRTGAGVERLQR